MAALTPDKLSGLSKEAKLKLLEAVQEKKRRQLAAKPHFAPHPGQARVIRSKALERYLFCGNGFGKSTLLCNELHWAASGFNPITGEYSPVPAKICLVLDTPEKIDEILTEYRKWFPLRDDQLHKRGKAYISAMTFDNGSSVTVLTHEVSELKPEGSQWTHLFFDEPPPRNLFVGLFRGGRIKGRPVKVLMAGTPIKAAWLRTDVYEPWLDGQMPDVECFTGDSDENAPNLEAGWLERFSSRLDEKERNIRLKGQFFDIEGLALAHLLKPALHLVNEQTLPWEREWPCVLIIDPHPSKAHNAVLLGSDKDNYLYVVEEYKEKAVARRFIENIIREGWFTRYRVVDIVYDSLGSADTTSGEGFRSFGEVINEVLKKHGLPRARPTTYDEKSDEDFIERIRDALVVPLEPNNFGQHVPKLRFYESCRGCYDDVKTVQWYEDRQLKENKNKLDLRKKDFLSCIKYGLATNLFYDKPRRQTPHYRTKEAYGVQLGAKRAGSRRYKAHPAFARDEDDD